MPNVEALLEAIKALPGERFAEVELFVASITSREHDRALVRAATSTSMPAFSAVWQNPEDDVYDAL